MNRENMMNMTVADLREYAREELSMTGISKLKKADLVDRIIEEMATISQLIEDVADSAVEEIVGEDPCGTKYIPREKDNSWMLSEANASEAEVEAETTPEEKTWFPKIINRKMRRKMKAIERKKSKRAVAA